MQRKSIFFLLCSILLSNVHLQGSQPAHPSFSSAYASALPGACGTWAANNTFNIVGGLGLIASAAYLYRRITRMERELATIKAQTTKIKSDVEEIKPAVHATHKTVTELAPIVNSIKTTTAHTQAQVKRIQEKQQEHDGQFMSIIDQIRSVTRKQDDILHLVKETHTHVTQQKPVHRFTPAHMYIAPALFKFAPRGN